MLNMKARVSIFMLTLLYCSFAQNQLKYFSLDSNSSRALFLHYVVLNRSKILINNVTYYCFQAASFKRSRIIVSFSAIVWPDCLKAKNVMSMIRQRNCSSISLKLGDAFFEYHGNTSQNSGCFCDAC